MNNRTVVNILSIALVLQLTCRWLYHYV